MRALRVISGIQARIVEVGYNLRDALERFSVGAEPSALGTQFKLCLAGELDSKLVENTLHCADNVLKLLQREDRCVRI